MSSTRIRALHIMPMTTWEADPDSDGSDYVPLRCDGVFDPVDATEIEDVGQSSGRNSPPELTITRSGAKLDLVIPHYGYATGSGDGDAAPTADALDLLLACAFGAAIQATGGEGVAASSTTSNLILDAPITGLTAGSLIPVTAADAPNRVIWRRVGTVATATYPVVPDWITAPVTAGVAYGVRGYGQADQLQTPTAGLAAIVNVAGTLHRLLGGRVMSLSKTAAAGKKIVWNASLMFDSWSTGITAASLPSVTSYPSPIVQNLAPFYWNGTLYATKSVKTDFGIKAVAVDATAGVNGRGSIDTVEIDPVITIEPAWAPGTWNSAFAAGTVGELLAQDGGAFAAAGRPNSGCFHALRAQIMAPPTNADDGGYLRQSVQIKTLDTLVAGARRWEYARC